VDPLTGAPQQSQQAAEPVDLNNVPVRINPALRDLRLADVLEIIAKVSEKPLKYSGTSANRKSRKAGLMRTGTLFKSTGSAACWDCCGAPVKGSTPPKP